MLRHWMVKWTCFRNIGSGEQIRPRNPAFPKRWMVAPNPGCISAVLTVCYASVFDPSHQERNHIGSTRDTLKTLNMWFQVQYLYVFLKTQLWIKNKRIWLSDINHTYFIRGENTVQNGQIWILNRGRQQLQNAGVCVWLLGQQPPQVRRATWSVFRLVDLMKPRNSSSDTAWINRAL